MEIICRALFYVGLIGISIAIPTLGFCSVESSLGSLQSKLNVLLPIVATLGLGWAALSFFVGSPNARGHAILAVVGGFIGFGAPSIISLIRSVIN